MGKTVTLRRPMPLSGYAIVNPFSGSAWTGYASNAPDAVLREQVTTSYRSSRFRQELLGESDVNEDLHSATNYRDRFRAMREEARNSGISSANDNGHEFSTQKAWIDYGKTVDETNLVFGFQPYRYRGPMVIRYPNYGSISYTGFQAVPAFSSGYYGTKAIAETAPTAPETSTLTSLIELYREGLPHLLGVQTGRNMRGSLGKKAARSSASDYLGYQFGWTPLVNDIVKSALAVTQAQRILEQYNRDSGRNVRRKYTFPTETDTTLTTVGGSIGPYSNTTGTQPWKNSTQSFLNVPIKKLVRTSRTIRFSGAYTYHSPYADSQTWENLHGYHRLAKRVLGLELTPEVVWNVIPWSWLADWQVNIGDIMSNMSSFGRDNLVLRYGYLMCHTVTQVDYIVDDPAAVTISGVRGPWVNTFWIEKKERIRAQPYGFGSVPGSYTSRQWAILGALGMTRAPQTLL